MRYVKSRKKNSKKNTKKIFRKKILYILIGLILSFIIGLGIYSLYLYNKLDNVLDDSYEAIERESDLRSKGVNPFENSVSVLFLGIDTSDTRGSSNGARSDAIILATFNINDRSIKLVSLPRDSYVYIKEIDRYDKLGHAHAYGGVSETIETIEKLLHVPVDYYVRLNFNGFVDVVNSLDGIKVNVPTRIVEQNSQDVGGTIILEPGIQVLNGEEALALARTRKIDNDIERGKRQQLILKAILLKAISFNSIPKYSSLMDAVGKNMKTNLVFEEIDAFLKYSNAVKENKIEQITFTGENLFINGRYYLKLDANQLNETILKLQDHIDFKLD